MKKLIPILIICALLISCGGKENRERSISKKHEPKFLYGVCIDSLDIIEDVVKKGDYLSKILLDKGVSYNTIEYLSKNKRNVLNPTKIKVGNKYTFLMSRDSVPQPKFWIYELDKLNYAVYCLSDSISAWSGQKEVITRVEHVGVEIKSSLWNAMVDVGCDPNLILELSDIYAWTIDFFGIQEGDSCKVIFEKQYIDDDTVSCGIGDILAAYFKNSGEGHYAFAYTQDGKKEYFDEEGANLRKAFLKAPLNYRRISSKFSNGRMHPIYHVVRPHHGVDYAAPSGTPVQTIGDGTVIEKGWDNKGGGNYMKIKHNSTYTTTYMHLKGFAKGISKGSKVKQGQVIGYVGSTGASTGPHLDFRLQKNGTYIDPLKFKSPSADPVKKENIERYKRDIQVYIDTLKEH
ncbi:MAG: peptidoglycan DD-metalloendopeptidase family protein [Bacteroidales bacterium]|nr:peptidoglycan DD-metalloendopeptidase family protein [Bacteroidales bacterium]